MRALFAVLAFLLLAGCILPPEQNQSLEPDCRYYYYFDSESTECDYGVYCGVFMYKGLQVFDTQSECESALNGPLPEEGVVTPTPSPTPGVVDYLATPGEEDCITQMDIRSAYNDNMCWVVVDGWVYDLTDAPQWALTGHAGGHVCMEDLSAALSSAPHGISLAEPFKMKRLC